MCNGQLRKRVKNGKCTEIISRKSAGAIANYGETIQVLETCRVCNGKGEVAEFCNKHKSRLIYGKDTNSGYCTECANNIKKVSCDNCHGKGRIIKKEDWDKFHTEKCNICNGNGFIKVEDLNNLVTLEQEIK
jgi:DnaJ-class molecular chaperone